MRRRRVRAPRSCVRIVPTTLALAAALAGYCRDGRRRPDSVRHDDRFVRGSGTVRSLADAYDGLRIRDGRVRRRYGSLPRAVFRSASDAGALAPTSATFPGVSV